MGWYLVISDAASTPLVVVVLRRNLERASLLIMCARFGVFLPTGIAETVARKTETKIVL